MIVDDLFESPQTCPECGGPAFSDLLLAEKKDACYHKVRSRYKVWPSAYASGALVQCRKKGAANWGNKSEGVAEGSEDLRAKLDLYNEKAFEAGHRHDDQAWRKYTKAAKQIADQLGLKYKVTGYGLEIIEQGVAEGSDNKSAGQAIQKLQSFAKMNPDFTLSDLERLPSHGMSIKQILSNAVVACDMLKQQYLANKQPGNAQFVNNLKSEINWFLTDRTQSQDPATLGELLQGTLGKINFQQGVAEGVDDTVEFEVDTEDAYNSIMDSFGSVIDWNGDALVIPRKYWNDVQQTAYEAGGEAKEYGDVGEAVAEGINDDLVYISKDQVAAFEQWMDSEGLETDVPKQEQGQYIVYDYTGQDHTSRTYAQEWNEKGQDLDEGDKVGGMDADKFDAAMARLKQLAGAGPLKTVWDPQKRVYRNVPTAVQPKQQPSK